MTNTNNCKIAWSNDPDEFELQVESEIEAIMSIVNKNLKDNGFKTLDNTSEEM